MIFSLTIWFVASCIALLGVYAYSFIRRKTPNVSFAGKTVWVTGASSGIGEALVYQFDRFDAKKIIISARREEALQKVKENCKHPDRVEIFAMDQSDPKVAMEEVQNRLGGETIDIAVYNAGIDQRALAVESHIDNDIKIMTVNFLSPIAMNKVILKGMKERQSGQIVVISSVVGKCALPKQAAYAASKHALFGYFDVVRAENIKEGIEVTAFAPGAINTDLGARNTLGAGKDEKHVQPEHETSFAISADDFAKKAIVDIYLRKKESMIAQPKFKILGLLRYVIPEIPFHLFGELQHGHDRGEKAANKS